MKWRVYPSDEERKADGTAVRGFEREGQTVSDAPPPGGRWAVTPDKKFHLVIMRAGRAWEIEEQ